jgi:hypothetical protein
MPKIDSIIQESIIFVEKESIFSGFILRTINGESMLVIPQFEFKLQPPKQTQMPNYWTSSLHGTKIFSF